MSEDDLDDLEVGEYFVRALPILDIPHLVKGPDGEARIPIFNIKYLEVRTKVESYDMAPRHILATSERLRNYLSFTMKYPMPLDITAEGKREQMEGFLPTPTLFDGSTLLPLTDGGFGNLSIFITRFGSHEGVRLPDDTYKSIENLRRRKAWFDHKISFAQALLDHIASGSDVDAAINKLGESYWTKSAKERFTYCMSAVEAISRHDFQVIWSKPEMHLSTMNRRCGRVIEQEEFTKLRLLRDKSVHSVLSEQESAEIHGLAENICEDSHKILASVLTELGYNVSSSEPPWLLNQIG